MARSAAPAAPSAPSFEGALERLEAIVERLEGGELPLEQALAAFEEGVALSRRCAGELEAAERRIELLVGGSDGAATEPFEQENDGEGEPGEPGRGSGEPGEPGHGPGEPGRAGRRREAGA